MVMASKMQENECGDGTSFVIALAGELLYDSTNSKRAVKAAFGSFMGFLTSTFIKFIVAFFYLFFFYMCFSHIVILFLINV